jgi:hypothetical protein
MIAQYTIRGKGMTAIHVAPCTMNSVGAFVKYANSVNVHFIKNQVMHLLRKLFYIHIKTLKKTPWP